MHAARLSALVLIASTFTVSIFALAGCGPAAPPPRTAGAAAPVPDSTASAQPAAGLAVPVPLTRLAAALEAAPRRCQDVCCFRELPQWAPLQAAPGAHAPALRGLIKRRAAPILRALALRWLAAGHDLADLELIESQIDDPALGWRAPGSSASMLQRVVPCPRIDDWKPRSVGQVALAAAGALAGAQRPTEAEYRAWRQLHPDVLGSLSYWQQRLPALSAAQGCAAALKPLARRDVRQLLRLMLVLGRRSSGPGPACPAPQLLRSLLAGRLGGGGLLGLLGAPARWQPDVDPAYAGQTAWDSLLRWALAQASTLFTPAQADALLKLRELPQVAASDELRGLLIAAVVDLDPARAQQLIIGAASGLKQPPPALVRLFARTVPSHRRVQAWMRSWSAGTCRPDPVAQAALEGLADAGAPGKAAIVRFLRRTKGEPWRQRPDLVRALADAAVKLGAPEARLACRERLRQVGCLKLTRQARSRQQAALGRAMMLCRAALGRWSGVQ